MTQLPDTMEETEIMPGVYFTSKEDIARQVETEKKKRLTEKEKNDMREMPLDALIFEIGQMKNRLIQLSASNDEMEKHINEDVELATYIVENIEYMALIRKQIDFMETLVEKET